MFLVAVNAVSLSSKKTPKDFWKNPVNKLKGGNPIALSLALTGTGVDGCGSILQCCEEGWKVLDEEAWWAESLAYDPRGS
jgi:hypothetical protein